ncbi:recombination protein RecR [candidate division WWE3 bacterium RIFOXYC1_FULL_40_10]|uniref:Recombination protein RecR n=1 Tax=candidate division WWE3 bacterium RIFOXYA2_FULL_46_9 TaxID=1802636 RepID=A0A1F4W1Q4_UNCKA|nr:MAG: recombination protein RecR [candidate division WWE3 bacterium RIFOXYB1_FULL_40_22]OGC61416.1 MAG: recombination protein RecR [candidate division WWE3 bacterium RIFOXYA1_FULL_40_11]OGC63349.1 MAG: recombination protein RecR [candidate division WWE3 bacterium RIFOXYA2_FULL_46_9]OGC65406.1 MAG: recombination protein RecR [candidate division WWE3 bacterium RIFOXYB2_FULL_41_6]OGC65799.1 MAG: recombination protein RecR [candidate division WWE3 bacterium RIFOXYC1_FULL_40_10]OGC67338.1 MAG: re
MTIPRPITKLIDHFQRLPGIGPKTAQRLVFELLHYPVAEIKKFSEALIDLKENTHLCSVCKSVAEDDICAVCQDQMRDKSTIAVVSGPLDVLAIEKTGYRGVYHVLHGVIDPLNNIGPDDIFISGLLDRLRDTSTIEIILATNTSMEGESTAMYISRLIREEGYDDSKIKLTRLARGLPVGGDIEYADDVTLQRALEGRYSF